MLILTIAILDSPKVFRLARSVAMNIVSLEFVEAARLRGEGWWWIVTREILPNAVPPLTAEFGLRFCFTFLFIAALSFLGLGVQPPDADWGGMVKDYARHDQLRLARRRSIPAAAIAILDDRRQFRRRLDAVDPFPRPGRRRMSPQPRDRHPIVLDIRSMRIAVRTDAGEGPVLVDDVSLSLKRGEVIGLIGESGAGKSTIGLASMGYTRRDCHIVGGNIVFGGMDIRAISADKRRALRGPKIAYIAQSAAASFNPAHTLMEQVCEAPIRHGVLTPAEARAEAISLFKQLDLPNPETIGARYPHQVSGGQLQRVMAAMAMVAKPDILIFDEPTTALDVTTQVECLAAFRKLIREHGTAALYITHDLAVVAQIADRIMVLKRGKMVEFGDSRQILQQPKEEYTRRLVSERVAGHKFVEASARRRDADSGDRPRQRQLSGKAAGHRRRQPRSAQGRHAGGGRRIGLGQIDPGARRHGVAAAQRRRRALQRGEPAAAAEGSHQGSAAPGADDLSDARRRAEPAAHLARHHRQARGVLFQPLARRSARARRWNCCARWTCRNPISPERPANCRADRSSASRSRGRWPPNPI